MSTDWQLNPAHSGTFLRLKRLLPKLRGFRVLFVQHNNPAYRDGIITSLSNKEEGVQRILDARNYNSYPILEQQLLAGSGSGDTHIISLESLSSEEQERTFKGLNYHREQLAENCQNTLIFWLPEPLINSLVQDAADFWAWREQVFDFLLPLENQPSWENFYSNTANLSSEKKRWRINELRTYLVAQDCTKQSRTTADMQHELGSLYEKVGEFELAEAAFDEALALFNALDERDASASVMMDQAYLRFKRGYFNEALKLLREDVLPVFEKNGDVHSKAITMGQIADILQSQSQFDEVLKIRKTEELPVLERLGDVRGVAVTMGKIADVLQLRGQFDEALEIRQNNELPVYEQLGDVQGKAVAMGKIADILQLRGQFDEALKIRENDELPVYEQLGDVRSKAVAMGRIAEIFQFRGQFDEALKIRESDEIPVYEQLGLMHELSLARANLAVLLWQMDPNKNKVRVQELLSTALVNARRLKIPEAKQIEIILNQYGLLELQKESG